MNTPVELPTTASPKIERQTNTQKAMLNKMQLSESTGTHIAD